ncbi:uncharacterized protein LOC115225894 [Octopus sinensis]|uniref:Uncharacterized protein LOC115225894 n=1 Tax=Octopus sinensis TaxID=2607531 RepID=A0A6P7TLH7_9MOLL|nr:uncharacterized protein LOC115225894 [Octopus sinensis]
MAACERRLVSCDEKQRIVCLHQEGESNSEIATTVGRSRSIMQQIVARFKSSESTDAKPQTGRLRKTSPRQDRIMARTSLKDTFKSAAEISRKFSSTSDVSLSHKIVSWRLRGSVLLAWVPKRSPRWLPVDGLKLVKEGPVMSALVVFLNK